MNYLIDYLDLEKGALFAGVIYKGNLSFSSAVLVLYICIMLFHKFPRTIVEKFSQNADKVIKLVSKYNGCYQ